MMRGDMARRVDRVKAYWRMTKPDLEAAAQGGTVAPFLDCMSAVLDGKKPVYYHAWGMPYDYEQYLFIVSQWTEELDDPRGKLFAAPIRNESGGITGAMIARTQEVADRAARAIRAIKPTLGADAELGRILGYGESDIAAWYFFDGAQAVFFGAAGGDLEKWVEMRRRWRETTTKTIEQIAQEVMNES